MCGCFACLSMRGRSVDYTAKVIIAYGDYGVGVAVSFFLRQL